MSFVKAQEHFEFKKITQICNQSITYKTVVEITERSRSKALS